MKCVRANSSCKCSLRYLNFKLNSEQQKFINTLSKKHIILKFLKLLLTVDNFMLLAVLFFKKIVLPSIKYCG